MKKLFLQKPENRRLIFEEAAGIAKYKSRKVEAERKLDRTKDNLTRLRDIIFELDKQLGPLTKQAEVAKQYLEFKADLKDREVNAYIYQYENTNDTKQKIVDKLDAVSQQITLRESDYNNVNLNYEKNMEEINNIDNKTARFKSKDIVINR